MFNLGGTFNTLAALLGRSVLRKSLDSYCRLVTSHGDNTLVADDGSLMTVFSLQGFRSLQGETELSKSVEDLRLALASQLGTRGYTLQFWFGHMPDLGKAEVNSALAVTASVAADMELDVDDLIEERRKLLPLKLTGERCYLALWSRPDLMTKDEVKTSVGKASTELRNAPKARNAQSPVTALEALVTRHTSFAQSIVRECSIVGLELIPMPVKVALNAIKGVLNPEFQLTGEQWTASLPSDYVRARMPATAAEMKSGDVSNILWPLLSRQLMTESGMVLDQNTFEFGNTIFAGFDMTLGPELVVHFNDLIRRVLDSNQRISWRVSMLIDSDGFQGQVFKETYSNIFTFTSPIGNSRIKKAFERLRLANGAGETVVRWRCSFAAWCNKEDRETLQSHVATLRQTVQGWGNCQTDALVGDPVECVMSSALAISAASTAPAAVASLSDVFALAPIGRPASPWETGPILFRTKDGKSWPYRPGSSQQLGWVDIIVGQPGTGKSVLVNSTNLGIALSRQSGRAAAGHGLLPRISIIDIGPSSEGFINLLKEGLPVNRRHEVIHVRLKNSDQFAVNPFDIQLCIRKPFDFELAYLVNLVCLCCTPDGQGAPYDGISAIARSSIIEAFDYYSDDRNPKKYAQSDSFEVDAALKELRFSSDEATTWWEVTDFLFSHGKQHQAALAQRFAVPTLADLVTISSSETVKEPFREMHVEATGEKVITAFQRMVTAATRDFPILARPTRFSVSDARIVAFDLEAVTSDSGPQAHRQSAIMYMLARQTVTSDFWLHEDDIKDRDMSEAVRDFHRQRIRNNKQMQKRICYDEYHRTGGLEYFRKQVENDNRVGRKTGVQQAYASQLIEDFDMATQELANNFFFCNVPTENSLQKLAKNYNLTPSVLSVLRGLHGPIYGEGAPFVAMMKLKSGVYIQHLFNQLGPVEIWALSTTHEDTSLRSMLYEAFGPQKARGVLARRFPKGSALELIESRLLAMESRGLAIDEKVRGNTIRMLADEMIKDANNA